MFTIANAVNADKVLKCGWFTECFYDEHIGEYDRNLPNPPALVVTAVEVETGLIAMLRGMTEDARLWRQADDLINCGKNIMDLGEDLRTVQSLSSTNPPNIIIWGN